MPIHSLPHPKLWTPSRPDVCVEQSAERLQRPTLQETLRAPRRSLRSTRGFFPVFLPYSFSPAQFTPVIWLRADMGVTNSSGVTAWSDQSGNGFNATGTASHLPTYSASGNSIGGPEVVFGGGPAGSGSSAMTIGAFGPLSTGAIVATVQTQTTASGICQVCQGTTAGGAGDWELWLASFVPKIYAGVTLSSGDTLGATSWHVIIANFLGTAGSNVSIDGTTQATGNTGTNTFGGSGLTLGNAVVLSAGSALRGGLTEFIVTPQPLSLSQIAQYVSWATSHWGVS
jgi:hypothetical protein